jgi:hypothetical protein
MREELCVRQLRVTVHIEAVIARGSHGLGNAFEQFHSLADLSLGQPNPSDTIERSVAVIAGRREGRHRALIVVNRFTETAD